MIQFMFSCIVVVLFLAMFGTLIGNLVRLTKFLITTFWPVAAILGVTVVLTYFYIGAFYA